ncbi:hypothetical protein COB57_04770 [Candidatus Peregrinibacteria bacterium]|nr:MAG: hypothetical protein COB57_04770 [Candidatus Peregrinibacteria bacterium]
MKQYILFFIVIAGVIFSLNKISHSVFPNEYQIHFFHITEGDAILIKTPSGKNILIDTGKNQITLNKIQKYNSMFQNTIDILFITHGDSDHIGGTASIANKMNIKSIVYSGANKPSRTFKNMEMQTKETPKNILFSNATWRIDQNILLETIAPLSNISYHDEHTNNDSLVFRLTFFNKKSILFTGDIEAETEKAILISGQDISADMLKVAHHGSKSSSIKTFIQNVSPKLAIIQAGKNNKFKHPHKETLKIFESFNIPTKITATSGDILFCISKKHPDFHICPQ